MTESTASIAQGYQACPAENFSCPYRRISAPKQDVVGAASRALQEFGTLKPTNEPPTPGEEKSILACIESMQLSLNDIHSVLFELETTRNTIDPRIKPYQDAELQLKRSIDEHRVLLSAIRRLSVELLVEIFSHVVEEKLFEPTEQAIHPEALYISHPPSPLLNLALTCRRWNSVVQGTPKLWSHINIDLCCIPDSKCPSKYYCQISRQLRNTTRRGHIPLSISIGTCDAWDSNFDLGPTTFLLPSYAASITHLTLFIPSDALECMNCIGPQLTRLVYATVANTSADLFPNTFEVFSQCTTLRTFNVINFDCFDGVTILSGVKHLSLRHQGITRGNAKYDQFVLDCFTLQDHIRKITPLVDGLETLCIDMSALDIELCDKTLLLMPRLKQLSVTSFSNKAISFLLKLVFLPSLEKLALRLSSVHSSPDNITSQYFQAISDLVQRSGCHLTTLELTLPANGAASHMIPALYQLPELEHLTIRQRSKSEVGRYFGDREFQKEGEVLLPVLQTLILDAAPISTQALPSLADWIEAREESAPLEKVVVISREIRNVDTDRMALRLFMLRMLELDGLEVQVKTSETKED
ncbi:hypothetical protein CYLTODRAFT_451196 [Cylindrobasidium torrendii FP15055 ss-10]|uniref:F-box domain-containing protein n=1 Tax=Cylindrobasidium torrendii FP15055 ss-10 TaxID=1314674 RepID=A0A0D7BMY3_9AGAR|nr:hypothetical protein CYLTODRAFT_451196 [Cylindrobasidium torrendii FP15055 ss-10]